MVLNPTINTTANAVEIVAMVNQTKMNIPLLAKLFILFIILGFQYLIKVILIHLLKVYLPVPSIILNVISVSKLHLNLCL